MKSLAFMDHLVILDQYWASSISPSTSAHSAFSLNLFSTTGSPLLCMLSEFPVSTMAPAIIILLTCLPIWIVTYFNWFSAVSLWIVTFPSWVNTDEYQSLSKHAQIAMTVEMLLSSVSIIYKVIYIVSTSKSTCRGIHKHRIWLNYTAQV